MKKTPYPFAAIVGQERMKKALILNVIHPGLSGVLIRGEKGTAKSTAVRALADILPEIAVVEGCPFQSDPDQPDLYSPHVQEQIAEGHALRRIQRKIRVVELPISATEDRVVGTIDLEHALKHGQKQIEPGILAAANRGILYVDEVNLLDDHVVDVLLDSAAMGVNTIEREGISFSHQARFTLVGTMNPEEGELRPQLLDRFGLCVTIEGLREPEHRVEIIRRRMAFEANPEGFTAQWALESERLTQRIAEASQRLPQVEAGDDVLEQIVRRSLEMGVDGHRSDIVMLKASKTLAAWHERTEVTADDIAEAAELALPHRVRRQPFEELIGHAG
ncbi:MAG: magnesium chelatase subunit I [Puniceicoccaceae bacterium 5H]|nr:MAG: magnesium chelatase subunit I [Puniceicoccaceae bacterium 5H]